MAYLLKDIKILEVSSVDKAANKDARVVFMKRDAEEESTVSIMRKSLSDDPSCRKSSPTWSRMALCQATIWTWC
jgi:hypothetical protein